MPHCGAEPLSSDRRVHSPYLVSRPWEKALDDKILNLIATSMAFCTPRCGRRRGHPPTETVRVLATLRQFLREGTPWRSLRATADKASGSTLRRSLEQWAQIGLLPQVHAVLIGLLRGAPTLILESSSVRAKRGGDLTGPNPTDRGKQGTNYHVAVNGDGVATACRSPAWPRRPTSMIPWCSSGCSWPPSP